MNARGRRRLGAGAGLLGLALALAVAAWSYYRRQPALGLSAYLQDGRQLTLCAITFGRENTVVHGDPVARFLDSLPDRWQPSWSWVRRLHTDVLTGHSRASEPQLVLWFLVSPFAPNLTPPPPKPKPPTAIPPHPPITHRTVGDSVFPRWKVIAPDGTEHGGRVASSVPRSSRTSLYPLVIDSYPRNSATFRVQFFDPTPATTNGPDAVLIGDYVIVNRQRSSTVPWPRPQLPASQRQDGVTCELTAFQIHRLGEATFPDAPTTNAGTGGGATPFAPPSVVNVVETFARNVDGGGGGAGSGAAPSLRDDSRFALATFRLSEAGRPAFSWALRQMTLFDPGGNVSHALSWQSRPLLDGTQEWRCRTLPLWPEDSAWKLRVDLVRAAPTAVPRLVRLSGLPFPPAVGVSVTMLETNVLDHTLRLIAMGSPNPNRFLETTLLHGYPHFRLHFGDQEHALGPILARPMMRLVEVRDEAGQLLPHTYLDPDQLNDAKDWILAFRGPEFRNPTSSSNGKAVDITLEFPEERSFEFLVPSGSVGPFR